MALGKNIPKFRSTVVLWLLAGLIALMHGTTQYVTMSETTKSSIASRSLDRIYRGLTGTRRPHVENVDIEGASQPSHVSNTWISSKHFALVAAGIITAGVLAPPQASYAARPQGKPLSETSSMFASIAVLATAPAFILSDMREKHDRKIVEAKPDTDWENRFLANDMFWEIPRVGAASEKPWKKWSPNDVKPMWTPACAKGPDWSPNTRANTKENLEALRSIGPILYNSPNVKK